MEKTAQWCVPDLTSEYRERMDDVLTVYEAPVVEDEPVVSIDEKLKELHSTPRQASRRDREDYEYRRKGTCNIFLACEPKTGWRRARVTDRRTAVDFARYLRKLMQGRYRNARRVHLVIDNLNTHSAESISEALGYDIDHPPAWLTKIAWHYTPKHASWLNAVESELSVLGRQCLSRRLATKDLVAFEVAAWEDQRNRMRVPINWTFTRVDARAKFPTLYEPKTSVADH